MDTRQVEIKGQTAHLLLHLLATEAQVTAKQQFHTGLQFVFLLIRYGLHKQVTQFLLELCRSQEEVHLHSFHLLHLEDIGIVACLGVLQVVDLQYLAVVSYLAVQKRHIELTAEATVGEVALYETGTDLVQRECPSAGLTRLGRKHIIGTDFQCGTGVVEEHVLGSNSKSFVTIGTKLQCFRHLDTDFLDIQSLPCHLISGNHGLALVVTGRECSHVCRIPIDGVVIHYVLGGESPTWQVFGLERIHRYVIYHPVVPVSHAGLDIQHGVLFLCHAIDILLQFGNLHVHIHAQQFECVGMP